MLFAPRVAVGPVPATFALDAIRAGGGIPVGLDSEADAIVWLAPRQMKELGAALDGRPEIRWVQLPFAGVEDAVRAGVIGHDRTWTCAKGSYAQPVAEHALALALAGLRCFGRRFRARRWGTEGGTSLFGAPVTILGGGGITTELLRLLAPFGVSATVVRRQADSLPGAARTVTTRDLDQALAGALVVFVALSLTPATERIVGAPQLASMDRRAWLVNVARGRHVDTGALVGALRDESIAGAALDVTDPEPLPDGHPLWDLPNCLITPHTADTKAMIEPLLAARISRNVKRFAAGAPLEGLIDPDAGY